MTDLELHFHKLCHKCLSFCDFKHIISSNPVWLPYSQRFSFLDVSLHFPLRDEPD